MKAAIAVATLVAAAFLFFGCGTTHAPQDAYPLEWQVTTNGQVHALKIENYGIDYHKQARVTQTRADGSSRVFEIVIQREHPLYLRCEAGERFKIEGLGEVKSFAVPRGPAGPIKFDDPQDGVYQRAP